MRAFFWIFLLFLVFPLVGQAQTNRDYLIATQLIRMQDYERAKVILLDLAKKEPQNALYNQQLITCFIQLKEYKNGIELLKNPKAKIKGNILLENEFANLHHLSGDTTKAFELWDALIKEQSQNIMAYQSIGQTLVERREFARAAKMYQTGRVQFKNSFLFLNELANAYLQSSNYSAAAKELIAILENNPGRSDLVQRQFSRYADEQLYDEAILLLEESGLDKIAVDETISQAKRELLLWLYLERNVDRRAISWAIVLEKRYPTDYFVFNVAQNLIRKESFELANQALQFYLDSNQPEMVALALEAKANMNVRWAKRLDEQGLSVLGKADSLLQNAAFLYEKVLLDFADFEPKEKVLLSLIDLYLENLGDVKKAKASYEKLLQLNDVLTNEDERSFLLGRFAMLDGDFRKARVELTRSNKAAKNANLLEKSRYFLALNDFYANDFEFAQIQLKAVERQNTSFYANDAIELRNWIRKGMQKDSVLPELMIFSKAMYAFSRTEFDACFTILTNDFAQLNELQVDAAQIITDIYRKKAPKEAYLWLGKFEQLSENESLYFNRVALGYLLASSKENPSVELNQAETELKAFLTKYPSGFFADKVRGFLQHILNSAS